MREGSVFYLDSLTISYIFINIMKKVNSLINRYTDDGPRYC